MKIRKRMSDKALLANRNNGKQGQGPENTDRTRYNAITHGLLARNLKFESEADKKSFDASMGELARYHRPVGPTEWSLVVIIAVCLWKLGELFGIESSEMQNRKDAGTAIARGLQGETLGLPLFSATQQRWEAKELVVRTGNSGPTDNWSTSDEADNATGHLIVEAKLTTSLDTILRYGASIKRDLYRALDKLQELQADRLELDPGSMKEEGDSEEK